MKKGFCFLAALTLSALGVFSLYASEETPEARIAYRRSTLTALVADSQRKIAASPSTKDQQNKDRSAPFLAEKNDPFVLDSDEASSEDLVEA